VYRQAALVWREARLGDIRRSKWQDQSMRWPSREGSLVRFVGHTRPTKQKLVETTSPCRGYTRPVSGTGPWCEDSTQGAKCQREKSVKSMVKPAVLLATANKPKLPKTKSPSCASPSCSPLAKPTSVDPLRRKPRRF